jgi:hypothetical protein
MSEAEARLPIYVSFATFNTCLDWLNDMPVLPSRIDRSLWGSKFGGGNGGQLMAGLRFLKLLDREVPTPALEELVKVDGASRKAMLAALLGDAYGSDLIDQLPRMTPRMLEDALRNLGSTDATLRKALSFLVNAARAVELPMAPAISKRARNKPSRASSKTSTRSRPPTNARNARTNSNGTRPGSELEVQHRGSGTTHSISLASGGKITVSVTVDLFKLSDYDRTYLLKWLDLANDYRPEELATNDDLSSAVA